jgi:hypothetical protein
MEPTNKQPKISKKEYMRTYMNNYYKIHKEDENKKCLARYYKKTSTVTEDDINTYGPHLAVILKTKKCLEQIKTECPQFLDSILL